MTATIYFGVPRTLLLTANQRLHWAAKKDRTKQLRHLAGTQAKTFKCAPMDSAHCIVEITWPDNRRRDAHNLMPTIKACIDGIVDAGLLPDDDDSHLTGPDLRVTTHRYRVPYMAVQLTFTFLPRAAAA